MSGGFIVGGNATCPVEGLSIRTFAEDGVHRFPSKGKRARAVELVIHETVTRSSSGAAWRARIIPNPPEETEFTPLRRRGRRLEWANLIRRVFLAEVLTCACGGTRRVISAIEEGPAARKILKHLELSNALPVLDPARLDQSELWPTGPPAEDACDPPYVDDVQRSPPDLAA